ncbi:RsmB/NOP family class I SAM-dependent RNA methyltransferase [Guggenheimella bovis]
MNFYTYLNHALEREKEGVDSKLILKDGRADLGSSYPHFHALFKGILETKSDLLRILQKHSKMSLKKYRKNHLNYMLIGIFSILESNTPDYAVVNEIVELVKAETPGLAALTNGILRTIARSSETLSFSTNPELRELIQKDYSLEFLEAYERELRRPVSLDILSLIDREELKEKLEREGNELTALTSRNGLRFNYKETTFENDPYFLNGSYYVQSEASQLVAELILKTKGKRVLDLCAAPGGKSITMYSLDPERSYLLNDVNEKKVQKIKENIERCKLPFETSVQDARILKDEWIDSFDVVFIDSPCSASGIMKRQMDVAKSRSKEDVDRIVTLQESILENAKHYVKKEGFLIYSTCSILERENEGQVRHFLENNRDFELISLEGEHTVHGFLKTSPAISGMDGFFGALLQRKSL